MDDIKFEPEKEAALDAYWFEENNNPYEGGTDDAYRYEIAFDKEVER
jgi:hypothetical protein